jgi:GNAT superfamily N-acetyltransferase
LRTEAFPNDPAFEVEHPDLGYGHNMDAWKVAHEQLRRRRIGYPPSPMATSVSTDTSNRECLRRLFHMTLRSVSPLTQYRASTARTVIADSVSLHSLGLPSLDDNFALVLGDVAPERLFALADTFFGGPHQYSVVIEAEAAPKTDEALRLGGWNLTEEEPALVLTPLPAEIPAPPAGLTIRHVVDEESLCDFFAISHSARLYIPSLAAATDPEVAVLVGYLGQQPVTTARIACLSGGGSKVAEITGVNTLQEHRRRGFGTAVVWAAIHAAANRGCDAAALNSSPLGYSLYREMGFVPVSTYRTYQPPA